MSSENNSQRDQLKEQRRKQILQTAFTLFSEKGYNETSMSGIAKSAGISKGLIYHYFDSKEELLRAIFTGFNSETVHKMDWNELDPPAQNLRKLIELAFQYLIQQTHIRRFSLSMAIHSSTVEGMEEIINAGKKQWESVFTGLFKKLGYYDPINEAFYLSALLDGIAVRYLASPTYPLEEMKQLILRNYKLN